jgi:subtilisin family serine protease
VIALLDTRVEAHGWLPDPVKGHSFCVEASHWPVQVPVPQLGKLSWDGLGTHWGHGTFIAGLIRQFAPFAQVLSVPLMSTAGKVSELNVIAALEWLAAETGPAPKVDVVLMAFGRTADADDPELGKVRDALEKLSERHVPVVASAGNRGSEVPEYPAAFAADPKLSVVSVGGRISPLERDPDSNYGVWVREWRKSTNLASIMTLPAGFPVPERYAWWNGTSFAAAIYAAELANRRRVEVPVPALVAES